MATSGRGKATTASQRSFILEWLETPANFRLITGGTQAGPVIARKKLKKTDAYNQLAAFINLKLNYTDPSEMWDQRIAKIRYESLVRTYKNTRDQYKDPSGKKFALTDAEISKGLTIEKKLNLICPYYKRWDNLFEGRQNVNPAHTFEGYQTIPTIADLIPPSPSALIPFYVNSQLLMPQKLQPGAN